MELGVNSPSDIESSSTQPGLMTQALHALRRRWLLCTLVAAAVGGTAGAVNWHVAESSHRASQLIKISVSQLPLVFQQAAAGGQANFETFKKSQRKMLTSNQVLSSAIQRQEVGELTALREAQQRMLDEVQWLRGKVSVTDEAEYLDVSVADAEPETAKVLLKAIIAVYKDVVMAEENREEQARLDTLEKVSSEYEESLRERRQNLKNLSALDGTPSGLNADDQDARLAELKSLREQIGAAEFELLTKQAELRLIQGQADGSEKDVVVTDTELDLAVGQDEETAKLRFRLDKFDGELANLKRTLKPDAPARVQRTPEIEAGIAELTEKIAQRREKVRELIAEQKRFDAMKRGFEPNALQLRIDTLGQILTELRGKEDHLRKELGAGLSEVAFDTLVARDDVEQREEVLDQIRAKIEETRIEIRSGDRISLSGEIYTTQLDTPVTRIKSSATTGAISGLVALVPLLWWDIRKKRLVHVQDLPATTNLELLGSLPLMPKQSWRRRRAALQLAESANSVAALLTHRVSEPRGSVVLVSSPMPGEGKTTLAAHLAASLALAGRRTLLIDCDLRRPSLHRIYDVELVPGFGDVLIAPETLDAAVQPTNLAGLSLLAAGSRTGTAIELLQTDRVAGLFKALREEFEFVVVDTSPILPVVDTRIIGRHADGIILSLLRDVTEVSKVVNACQIMSAFGIPVLGAVMIGAGGELYYDDQGTVAAQSA
jgi:capsular exopolysaccharide synthesis family protein